MSDVFNEKRVKTRKPHRCAYCAGEIAAANADAPTIESARGAE